MENKQIIKCVAWDLDNTLWNGVLLESGEVTLNMQAVTIIHALDERGILHSITSRNDKERAWAQVEAFGLGDYFLFPEISWGAKSHAIENIARALNISLDAVAFIDDQEYERLEVAYAHPEVLCLSPETFDELLNMPRFQPSSITEETGKRRIMYQQSIIRDREEERFEGPKLDFLKQLDMQFSIQRATEKDLNRVEELTVRTHQLNTTGYTYSYEQLRDFIYSPSHILYIADLSDRYGAYGKIGICLLECSSNVWTIKLLLMSCRVMNRGLGNVFLLYIIQLAQQSQVKLRAEFRHSGVNRMMYMTYKLMGFVKLSQSDEFELLELTQGQYNQQIPEYVKLVGEGLLTAEDDECERQ